MLSDLNFKKKIMHLYTEETFITRKENFAFPIEACFLYFILNIKSPHSHPKFDLTRIGYQFYSVVSFIR